MIKRTLTGKQVRDSKEQREIKTARIWQERDLYDLENLGGYEKIYPKENSKHYDKFMKEADR